MKNHANIILFLGLAAVFFAIVLNLVPETSLTLAIEAVIAAVIALICGALTFRKGGGWRFLAIAMIGPGVFVLSDSGVRLLYFLQHRV